MSMNNRGYVPMQSMAGARRMVLGMFAHELAKRGLLLTEEQEEKLIDLYLLLKEAQYPNAEIMMIMEGYVMRLGMNIHTAKRSSDGKFIQVSETSTGNKVTNVVIINEVPKRRIFTDSRGTYVNYKRERYYFE